MIRDALAELMIEKGFDGVTICDLSERADLNRGTFYSHYRDKYDLLTQSEDELIDEIVAIQEGLREVSIEELLEARSTGKPLSFAVALYDYLRENGAFMRVLLGPQGDPRFQVRLKETICKNMIENVLDDSYTKDVDPLTDYYVAYYASAQLGIIQRWLETEMREGSEEMARIVTAIMFMQPGDVIKMDSLR